MTIDVEYTLCRTSRYGDMSVCPDCHAKKYPIRDIENPNRQECTERCGAYIFWNHRRKVPRAEWTSENWG